MIDTKCCDAVTFVKPCRLTYSCHKYII